MPETVWAIHNFEAEAEDEISFHIGEPIIIVQKDELYQDGWWEVSKPLAIVVILTGEGFIYARTAIAQSLGKTRMSTLCTRLFKDLPACLPTVGDGLVLLVVDYMKQRPSLHPDNNIFHPAVGHTCQNEHVLGHGTLRGFSPCACVRKRER